MVSLRTGHVSVTGNYRENNEDSCYIDGQQRLFIVADGMGGQSAGERASALAVELIPRRIEQLLDFDKANAKTVSEVLEKSISHANSEVIALSEVEPGLKNMGTTVVMMVRVADRFFFIGVGDSRAYELRGGKLRQLTTDHSVTQALLDSGTISPEEAKTHRWRNTLYKYIGCRDGVNGANVTEIVPRPGDRFMLCSDGLNDGLESTEITRLLQSSNDPQEVAEKLVKAALDAGSRDNVTCVVAIVD
ncbi:MAG: serine/threonine-protein phosphatase [Planctomycetaceae bacterium]|nr:serine/threonine-protein phosphatase [Planctomycetaceae bacterium]